MFVLVKEDFLIEKKFAWLFDNFKDAYKYMENDLKVEKLESVRRLDDMISSGVFPDKTHAYMETDTTEINWDIIEVLEK